jgi:hypothetical protein
MPDKETIKRARADKRAGKSASTQAGEFVHREIDRIRKGEHGARNARQAIAIGLSEARRAGVDLPENPNRKSPAKSSRKPRKSGAARSSASRKKSTSASRSKSALKALKKMPRRAASHRALSRQAHRTARTRTGASRSASARKAARTRAANRAGR